VYLLSFKLHQLTTEIKGGNIGTRHVCCNYSICICRESKN